MALPHVSSEDFLLIGFLVFLEGILSVDNALVLAMMAKPLPQELQKRALTYGLVGALGFRIAALFLVTFLLKWDWVKFVGGAYLFGLAAKHFLSSKTEKHLSHPRTVAPSQTRGLRFWKLVVLIELMDIAFAIDSILAAVAVTKKVWIVFTGGFLGVVMMRFAAALFIQLLDRFPRFEGSAYLLVGVIGVKVFIEGLKLPGVDFQSSHDLSFWIFWVIVVCLIGFGFIKPDEKKV